MERDKTVRQLVLIKRQYIFICSFNKYVLSGDHGLSTELSTEDIVMINKIDIVVGLMDLND